MYYLCIGFGNSPCRNIKKLTIMLFHYSVYHSVTGEFLGAVTFESLKDCRSWRHDLASSLGLSVKDVYGRYYVSCI